MEQEVPKCTHRSGDCFTMGFHAKHNAMMIGCRCKSNCPLVGPGTISGMSFVGVFLRDPNLYLCEFRRKPWKTLKGQSPRTTGNRTRQLPSTSFECTTAPSLVGRKCNENSRFVNTNHLIELPFQHFSELAINSQYQ